MRKEIEARLLDIDEKAFIKKLKGVGAKFVGDWIQIRNCYDFKPPLENKWIRLRTNGVSSTLTIKEIENSAIDGTKEAEIKVSDFDTCNEILNQLGFETRSRQENRRIRFFLENVEIDVDLWPKIPTYAEFEAKSKSQIEAVCKKLGIDFGSLVTLDVDKIYAHFGFDKAVSRGNLLLEEERKNMKL